MISKHTINSAEINDKFSGAYHRLRYLLGDETTNTIGLFDVIDNELTSNRNDSVNSYLNIMNNDELYSSVITPILNKLYYLSCWR